MFLDQVKDRFNDFTVEECREAISLLKARIKLLTSKRKALERTMDDLDLSVRAYNIAKRAGIETVRDILKKGEDVLYSQPGGGIKTVREILVKAGLPNLAKNRYRMHATKLQ
jgi:DNA-directed RNA polymerase subunit alpha